ncbi:MAG: hypothetical protein ACXVPK_11365 [Tumebacillaceae bacterium]
MLKLQFPNANDNGDIINEIINLIQAESQDIYWGVGDIEITPKFRGDYPGTGNHKFEEIAFDFGEKVDTEKIVFITTSHLLKVLDDTQSIRRAVFICFSKKDPYDFNLRPMVETKEKNKLQHKSARLELRILDGDLFFILTDESRLTDLLIAKFREYVIR